MVVLICTQCLSTVGLHKDQEKVRKYVPQSQEVFMWEMVGGGVVLSIKLIQNTNNQPNGK